MSNTIGKTIGDVSQTIGDVIAEVRTTGAESILVSPGIMGFNNDNPRTDNIYLLVTNRSGSTTTFTVTLTALQIGE